MNLYWILLLAYSIICGALSFYVASEKKRYSLGWFFMGFVLGILGLITIAGLPSLKDVITSENKTKHSVETKRRRPKTPRTHCAECGEELTFNKMMTVKEIDGELICKPCYKLNTKLNQ